MRSALFICFFALLALSSCGDHGTSIIARTLEGQWDLVGYSDGGVSGTTTGIASFLDNGTFSILGTVTYPGEPTDTLEVYGTYEVNANIVTLTTTEGSGDWAMAFSGDRVTLTRLGADPATIMTLRKRT